jgi:hypothetical protein
MHVFTPQAALKRLVDTEAGEEDELGQLRKNHDGEDEEDGLDALDPTLVDDSNAQLDGTTAGRTARLHSKLMSEQDEMLTSMLENRFVNGDRFLAARAAALARLNVLGTGRGSSTIMSGLDLTGNDSIVMKKRRGLPSTTPTGSNLADLLSSADWYAGENEDDLYFGDETGMATGYQTAAQRVSEEDEEGLSSWERHLRSIARAQKELQQQEQDQQHQLFLQRQAGILAAPPGLLPSPASALAPPSTLPTASPPAPLPPALLRARSNSGAIAAPVSTTASFYGLEDESTNGDLAAHLAERKFRLQVCSSIPSLLCTAF